MNQTVPNSVVVALIWMRIFYARCCTRFLTGNSLFHFRTLDNFKTDSVFSSNVVCKKQIFNCRSVSFFPLQGGQLFERRGYFGKCNVCLRQGKVITFSKANKRFSLLIIRPKRCFVFKSQVRLSSEINFGEKRRRKNRMKSGKGPRLGQQRIRLYLLCFLFARNFISFAKSTNP